MCLYPKIIKNKKYQANKKNGGNTPVIPDKRVLYVPVGCGKCMECMKKKSREWQVRVSEEIRHDKTGAFVTLTFNEESLKELREIAKKESNGAKIEDNEIAKIATRRFLERWRKKYKKSVKHWLVTELGHNGTERIHMHGIIWTKEKEEIKKIWKYGMVWLGTYVTEKTVNYIIKYINKADTNHKGYTSKIMCSPGIGKGYMERSDWNNNKYKEGETNEAYKHRNGVKGSLPIYYRNKIYNEEEREKLWIEKLNKNIRWVGGEKIDVSTIEGLREYNNLLEYYQNKNKKLGYGDDTKEWSKEEYNKKWREMSEARKDRD